jgi:hypothetical protein
MIRAVCCAVLSACGYVPVHTVHAESEKLAVAIVSVQAGDAGTLEALRSGVTQGLTERGMLRAGSDYPRVEVELVRIDRMAEGAAASPGSTGALARAFRVVVTGRAWVAKDKDTHVDETGELREDVVRAAEQGQSEALADIDSVRFVSQALGRKLARKIQGEPSVEGSP